MRNKQLFGLLLIGLLLSGLVFTIRFSLQNQSTQSQANLSTPSVYWGAYLPSNPDMGGVTSFENLVHKPMSLVSWFQPWNGGGFPTGAMDSIRNHGAIPVISWDSYDGTPASSWTNIKNGNFDDYITQWANDSKNWGHPYFLRFDWEMNGYWQPFAKNASDFVPMWQHVHDIFTRVGATNVTWVWCPNVDGYSTMPLEGLYPGNNYVDWVCMDAYNFGSTQSWSSWTSFSDLFSPTYNHLLTLAPGKPIMIAETGSAESGGSKPQWITDTLETQLPNNFPDVKAYLWFNESKETDWRVESSPGSLTAFSFGIAQPYYASNQFSTLSSSPIPPLTPLTGNHAAIIEPTSLPTQQPTATPTLLPTKSPTPLPPAPRSCNPTTCSVPSHTQIILVTAVLLFLCLVSVLFLRSRIRKN